ncbi:MAG: aminopeptidase [Flaviaesturariibacter sp.]|nr:aminopeptidase [Flaviaesturariibacter sp.]
MRKIVFAATMILSVSAVAQKADGLISAKEVERIETVLAADDMEGRRPGTPGSEKAAEFIATEFKKAGLQPLQGNSFMQEFPIVRPKLLSVKGEVDDVELDPKNIIVSTSQADLKVNEKMGYAIQHITTSNFQNQVQAIRRANQNTVVFVDTSFSKLFPRLGGSRPGFKSPVNIIFILGDANPKEFTIKAEHSFEETMYKNVVGIIPGKSRKDEQVIFSGHYDHLGIGKPVNGDSIYNGANDDAAGITAVIMLANYYKKMGGAERTLVFSAFTAEESGGFGATYFSRQLAPEKVMAMFNIEMIGTESKWGRNSAFITGFEKSDMGAILQRNLEGSGFTFHPDPYPQQNLFYRSDNATLARLGVPAHTISTSKMDVEPNYHKVSDEVGTLDMENMAAIISAIAKSATSIVMGKDTPSRVKPEGLQ